MLLALKNEFVHALRIGISLAAPLQHCGLICSQPYLFGQFPRGREDLKTWFEVLELDDTSVTAETYNVLNSKRLASSLRRRGSDRIQKFADENPGTAAAMERHLGASPVDDGRHFFTPGCRFATDR
jgi:hypothetical protein